MSLSLCPVSYEEACTYVGLHHRHHKAPVGHKWSVAVHDGFEIRGVAMVSRPVSRHEDNGRTLEVVRLCTDGAKNASSMLLGACQRATWAMGYTRLVTMTLTAEGGSSLRAAGYRLVGERPDAHWNRPGRPRVETMTGPKFKWEITP